MLFRVTLIVALLGVALCEDSPASKVLNQFRARNKAALVAHVDEAFKSTRFEAVGSLRGRELDSSAYSSTGSVYQSVFINTDGIATDDTCSNLSAVIGYAVNKCVVNPGYAFKFQLTADSCNGALIQYFADQKCTNYLGSSTFDASVNVCSVSKDPQMEANEYQKIQCTTSPSPPFPTQTLAGEFYEDSTCSGDAVEYEGFTVDKCFNAGPFFAEYTCDGDKPSFSVYETNTCTGTPIDQESFSSQCFAETDDYEGDNHPYLPPIFNPPPSVSTTPFPTAKGAARSTAVFCTAGEPTLKPAFAPTIYPTSSALHTVWFEVTQNINGVTTSKFNANNANLLALIKTIAGTMTQVPTTAVTQLVVSDVPTSAARLGSATATSTVSVASAAAAVGAVHNSVAPLATTGAAIQIKYTVKTSTGFSAHQLWTELSTAVSSGSFNADLNANALNSNTDLIGCTSSSATSRHFSDDKETGLSGGQIFGVVVGGLFLGVMAVGAVYLLVIKKG